MEGVKTHGLLDPFDRLIMPAHKAQNPSHVCDGGGLVGVEGSGLLHIVQRNVGLTAADVDLAKDHMGPAVVVVERHGFLGALESPVQGVVAALAPNPI